MVRGGWLILGVAIFQINPCLLTDALEDLGDACPSGESCDAEIQAMRNELLQVQVGQKRTSSHDSKIVVNDTDECTAYMSSEGCKWTMDWTCPGQGGGNGPAARDGSLGYKCCCLNGLWKNVEGAHVTPTPGPTKPAQYWSTGTHKYMKVYHQTSPEVCALIMKGNFILGKGGLCGRAVYFALSAEATKGKAITSNSHGGCMIEATVDVGKTGRYYWRGSPQWKDGQKEKYCGGWNKMTGQICHKAGYDSIIMSQGDGDEVIVFEPARIISKKVVKFKCEWMCQGDCQKHWPSYCNGGHDPPRRRYQSWHRRRR